jgi:hypothetical protein
MQKKFLRLAGKAIVYALALYVGYGMLWLALIIACTQEGNQCGGDAMSASVRILYGWIFK